MSLYAKANGSNFYWKFYYLDDDGKRVQKSINTGIQNVRGNKRKAMEQGKLLEDEFLASLDDKKVRHRDRGLEHREDTVEQFAHFWLDKRLDYLRENTLYSYKLVVNRHIIPYIGNMKLKEIDQYDVEEFIDLHIKKCKLLEKQVQEKRLRGEKVASDERAYSLSIKKIVHILSMMLSDAVSVGAIQENPVHKVSTKAKKSIPQSNFRGKAYTLEEHQKLIEVCKGSTIEPAIMLTAYLGLRREEVLGLKWSDVDLENETVTIRNTVVTSGGRILYHDNQTKNEKSMDILPLIPPLKEYLIGLKQRQEEDAKAFGRGYEESDYICRWNDGRLIKPDYVTHGFRKLLQEKGMRVIRFHDLRDTVVTLVWETTKDIKKAQIIARHTRIDMTADRYTDPKLDDKKDGLTQAFNI